MDRDKDRDIAITDLRKRFDELKALILKMQPAPGGEVIPAPPEQGKPGPVGPIGPVGPPGPIGPVGPPVAVDVALLKDIEARIALLETSVDKVASGDSAEIAKLRGRMDALEARISSLLAVLESLGPTVRVIYFTARGDVEAASADSAAEQRKASGYPILIVTLLPTEVNVANMPRLYVVGERRMIVGTSNVVAYLTSLTQ